MGQWRYSMHAYKLTASLRVAERVYSLAQEQNDSALMIGAYRALAGTFSSLGDFENSRQYAMRGVQIWRSRSIHALVEELTGSVVTCLCEEAHSEWHLGEIASSRATMTEAISLAKELKDMYALAVALWSAGLLAYFERNPVEVERLASDLIELSTRHDFACWLAAEGTVLRGWARSVSGETAEGISWIQDGIGRFQVTGSMLEMPLLLALKAEALHLAHRTSEAVEAIREAEVLVERSEERCWCAELHRLRGVFLANMGADETHIEDSFRKAISTANEQKSISLAARAEASYSEYRARREERRA